MFQICDYFVIDFKVTLAFEFCWNRSADHFHSDDLILEFNLIGFWYL